MNPSLNIKYALARLFHFSGLVKHTIKSNSSDKYPILMYHRVIPSEEFAHGQAGMFVEPSTFEMHVRYLTKNFEIISLSRLMERVNNNRYLKNRPICVLTFDDGWSDFYKHAYPILGEHKVPATVFLPTKFIGSKRRFWTDRLSELIGNRKRGLGRDERTKITPANPDLEKILNLRGSQESITEYAISLLKGLKEDQVWEILEKLETAWGVTDTSHDGVFLQWEEVQKMAGSDLITFGSHTDSHKILTSLNEDEVQEELIKSKEILISKSAVHPSFIPFSYPNGNYDGRIVDLVRNSGYHAAVTTEDGWNGSETPPFQLRRMAIHQDMSSTKEMFGCRISNIF